MSQYRPFDFCLKVIVEQSHYDGEKKTNYHQNINE